MCVYVCATVCMCACLSACLCVCVCVCTHTYGGSNMMGDFHLWDPKGIDWKGQYMDWPVNCLSNLVLWGTRTIADLNSWTCSPLAAHTETLNIAALCRMLPHTRGTMSTHGWPWETLESTILNFWTCVFTYVLKPARLLGSHRFSGWSFFYSVESGVFFGICNYKTVHSSKRHWQQTLP